MPELKHAARKAAKKSAKKAAKKSANSTAKDTRRAYEHLGRVQALAATVPASDSEAAKILSGQAEQAMRAGGAKDAAELLRAAEHHLFGTQAQTQPADESLSSALLESVREECDGLAAKAEERGGCTSAPRAISAIYKAMRKDSAAALKAKRFRAALEFARGAEALTHADVSKLLPASRGTKLIRA